MHFSLFGKIFNFYVANKPKAQVYGLTSRTEDGYHALFLDYDSVNKDVVAYDIENLSDVCSHFFLFTTGEKKDKNGEYGNYHVICIDKFNFGDVFDIMKTCHTDRAHLNMARKTRYRTWVLRFTGKGNRPKPKYLDFVEGNPQEDIQHSRSHFKTLFTLYPEIKDEVKGFVWNFDNGRKATITHYNTANNLK